MKPSELAKRLAELRERFEEDWDPEDVKAIAEFVVEEGAPFVIALRHHEALVQHLKNSICDARRDDEGDVLNDSDGACECCEQFSCKPAHELFATIEREGRS